MKLKTILTLSVLLSSIVTNASTICAKLEKYPKYPDLPDQVCYEITGDTLTGTLLNNGNFVDKITGKIALQPAETSYNKHTGDPMHIPPYNKAYFYTDAAGSYSGEIKYPESPDSLRGFVQVYDSKFGTPVFTISVCQSNFYASGPFCKY